MTDCRCHSHNGFALVGDPQIDLDLEISRAQAEERGLTAGDNSVRLDMSDSVSGTSFVDLHWDDELIDVQYRRFIELPSVEGV